MYAYFIRLGLRISNAGGTGTTGGGGGGKGQSWLGESLGTRLGNFPLA